MALQAPAIVDVRPGGVKMPPGLANWLRGIGVRQVRLACGLVMFTYIFSHFFNHALGNISYDAMQTWLTYHVWFWRIPTVNFTLYAAATTHAGLGLWALYQRRYFRYTTAEITQLVLGLSIPLLLASHFGIVRVAGIVFDRPPPEYATPLFGYWVARPYMIAVQFTLLTVAWAHGCIGLYFWLRLKPFSNGRRHFCWQSPCYCRRWPCSARIMALRRSSGSPRSRNGVPRMCIPSRRHSGRLSMISRCFTFRSRILASSVWYLSHAACARCASAGAA